MGFFANNKVYNCLNTFCMSWTVGSRHWDTKGRRYPHRHDVRAQAGVALDAFFYMAGGLVRVPAPIPPVQIPQIHGFMNFGEMVS